MHSIWLFSLLATIAAGAPFVTNEATSISYQGTSADGVDQFQGIFFAEDTSGANRFAPPKPYSPPHGTVVDATRPGAACPQPTPGIVPFMSDVNYQSENCLNLRIARPAVLIGQSPLPVMVYLYGGGSILGTAYDGLFNPTGLVQQSVANGDPVVYVALNYRIGIFGFAAAKALRDAKSENIGLRDQRAAIGWIRDNIAAFGGDPDNITLFGQSFGGISVGLQLVAYAGRREFLFHKAIMASGGISVNRLDTLSVKNTAEVAETLKCIVAGGTVDDAALDCLRKTPLATLVKVELDQAARSKPSFGFAAFSAVVDGDLIPDQPSKLFQEGQFYKNVPLLATWTADDGSLSADTATADDAGVIKTFAPYFPNLSTEAASKILSLYPLSEFEATARASDPKATAQYFRASRIVRDIDPTCPIIAFSRSVYEHGNADVYLAELNATRLKPYWDAWRSPYGVSHLSDVPYFFNEALPAPGENRPADFALAAQYSGSFAAFAHRGNPVKKGSVTFQEWPEAYSAIANEETTVLIIGGPYGTGPATVGPTTSHESHHRGALEQGKQVVFGGLGRSGPAATRGRSHTWEARGEAFEAEKLIERCAYIESIRV